MTLEKLAALKMPVVIVLKGKSSIINIEEYFYVTAFDYKFERDKEPEPEIGASIMIGTFRGQPGILIATNPEEVKQEKIKPGSVFAVKAQHKVAGGQTGAKRDIIRHLFDIENVFKSS